MNEYYKFLSYCFTYMRRAHITDLWPDSLFLKYYYFVNTKKRLNLRNPQSFNEKLQWLKLYDRKPLYTQMVDKYEAKSYVAEVIGQQYIIPTIGVWDNFDEIDFERLPNTFVLKCTHDSGGLIICKDKSKLDYNNARKKIESSLRRNYFYFNREWPYKNVKPRIIAEKYMVDEIDYKNDTSNVKMENQNVEAHESALVDYKLMCFNGEFKCCFTCTDRFNGSGLKVTFFDRQWNKMPFERHYPKDNREIKKPQNFEEMIGLAEKLSINIPFVRVDFYEINGRIYFGELTFFPGSGIEEFTPETWDYTLGSWINLP